MRPLLYFLRYFNEHERGMNVALLVLSKANYLQRGLLIRIPMTYGD